MLAKLGSVGFEAAMAAGSPERDFEPRSDDGFTAWGFFDQGIEAGTFPVLTVPAGGD